MALTKLTEPVKSIKPAVLYQDRDENGQQYWMMGQGGTGVRTIFLLLSCTGKSTIIKKQLKGDESKSVEVFFQGLEACPTKVVRGVYLDGGTVSVVVTYSSAKTHYFGLEMMDALEVENSQKLLSDEEITIIDEQRKSKVFVGVIIPVNLKQ